MWSNRPLLVTSRTTRGEYIEERKRNVKALGGPRRIHCTTKNFEERGGLLPSPSKDVRGSVDEKEGRGGTGGGGGFKGEGAQDAKREGQ